MKALQTLGAGLLLLATLAFLPPAEAADFTILEERFEGAWPGAWSVGDEDLSAGLDYWGVTSAREDGGSFSAWAAQVGTSSQNGLPNFVNRFQDDSMDAYLRLPVEDLAGYAQVTLRFSYWSEMEAGDSLVVRVQSGGSWFTLWSVQGPLVRDWTTVALDIPLSTDLLEFRYVSAAFHILEFEGAYLDDVRIVGDDDTAPLISITEPFEGSWYDSRSLLVTWSADDLGSGIQYMELRLDFLSWFNVGLETSYALTGLTEGLHTVTVRAADRADNVAVRSVTFGVDVTAPSATIIKPAEGSTITSSPLDLEWQAQDAVSGVSGVEVSVDQGAWTAVDNLGPHELSDLRDGTHTVALRVTDSAGNAFEAEVNFRLDTNPFSPDGPNKGFLLYGLIAGGLVALLLALGWLGRLPFWPAVLRRKTERKARTTPLPKEGDHQNPGPQAEEPDRTDEDAEEGGGRRGREEAS